MAVRVPTYPDDVVRVDTALARLVPAFYARHPSLGHWRPPILAAWGGGRVPEATYDARGRVLLYPRFWTLTRSEQDWILAHELGHHVESQIGLSGLHVAMTALGLDPWDVASFPYAQVRSDEAFAECFAAYHLDPSDLLRRHARWADLVAVLTDRVPS